MFSIDLESENNFLINFIVEIKMLPVCFYRITHTDLNAARTWLIQMGKGAEINDIDLVFYYSEPVKALQDKSYRFHFDFRFIAWLFQGKYFNPLKSNALKLQESAETTYCQR